MRTVVSALLALAFGVTVAGAADRLHCVESDPVTGRSLEAKPRKLIPGETLWLKPGGAFTFKVECRERLPRQYRLRVELWDADQPAAIADLLLARDQPLTLRSIRQTWKLWVD